MKNSFGNVDYDGYMTGKDVSEENLGTNISSYLYHIQYDRTDDNKYFLKFLNCKPLFPIDVICKHSKSYNNTYYFHVLQDLINLSIHFDKLHFRSTFTNLDEIAIEKEIVKQQVDNLLVNIENFVKERDVILNFQYDDKTKSIFHNSDCFCRFRNWNENCFRELINCFALISKVKEPDRLVTNDYYWNRDINTGEYIASKKQNLYHTAGFISYHEFRNYIRTFCESDSEYFYEKYHVDYAKDGIYKAKELLMNCSPENKEMCEKQLELSENMYEFYINMIDDINISKVFTKENLMNIHDAMFQLEQKEFAINEFIYKIMNNSLIKY